jgi:hypothetical protein
MFFWNVVSCMFKLNIINKDMKTSVILFFAVFSLGILAQPPDISTPQLKSSDVENFLKHFKSIEEDFKTLDMDYESQNNFEAYLQGIGNYDEANKVVNKYGYTDINDFILKAWAISASYATLKMETGGMPEMQQALDEIEKNESMTAEQKEAAKQQVKMIMEALGTSIITQTNDKDVAVVKPYAEKLELLFEGK